MLDRILTAIFHNFISNLHGPSRWPSTAFVWIFLLNLGFLSFAVISFWIIHAGKADQWIIRAWYQHIAQRAGDVEMLLKFCSVSKCTKTHVSYWLAEPTWTTHPSPMDLILPICKYNQNRRGHQFRYVHLWKIKMWYILYLYEYNVIISRSITIINIKLSIIMETNHPLVNNSHIANSTIVIIWAVSKNQLSPIPLSNTIS